MIAACEQYGLRTPDFHQTDDFRTIIYRKEKVSNPTQKVSNLDEKVSNLAQKVSNLGEKVTEQTEKSIQAESKSNQPAQKSNQVKSKSNQVRLTAKQRKVLEFCDETPRTTQEILDMLGLQNQNKTRQQYTTKLVLAGVLRPTTVSRNDSNRKYITAHSD